MILSIQNMVRQTQSALFWKVVLIKEKCRDVIIHSGKLFKDGGSQDAKRRSFCKSCDFENLTISLDCDLGINLNPIDLKKCLFAKEQNALFLSSIFFWHFVSPSLDMIKSLFICIFGYATIVYVCRDAYQHWLAHTGVKPSEKRFAGYLVPKMISPSYFIPLSWNCSLWMEPVCRTYVRQPVKIQNHSPLLELRFWMGASLREK